MKNNNFLQKKDLFELNSLKCLRNEYFFNECDLCFSRCSYEAISLQKEKIKLIEDKCTSCGDCIGVCPTQALSIENFDVENFVLDFISKDKNLIIEKIDLPSFGMLDIHHLITILLRKKENIVLEYDENSRNINYIEEEIRKTNNFIKTLNFNFTILIQVHKDKVENKLRRNLFKSILSSKKELAKESKISSKINEKNTKIPAKLVLLKNSLKLISEKTDLEKVYLEKSSFITNKTINYESCTNCLDCITFCPTDSLFQNSEKDSIFFQTGKCIECRICNDICKENAIFENENINLFDFTFDRAEELVKFQYETCTECNSVFIYKSGDIICPQCSEFRDNYSSMFTLAKDI